MVISELITGISSTTGIDDTSLIKEAINRILRDLSTKVEIEALKTEIDFSISDGDYYKSLPSDFSMWLGHPRLRYGTTNGYPLTKRNRDWFDIYYPNLPAETNKNKPTDYYIQGKKLFFAPKCDSSYTMPFPYQRVHPEVETDSDTIYYDSDWKNAILDGVKGVLFNDLGLDDQAAKYMNQYIGERTLQADREDKNIKGVTIVEYNDF